MRGCSSCDDDCASPRLGFAPTSQGTPGGTLPDGDAGDFLQWNGTLWVPSAWTLPLSVAEGDLGEVLTVTAAGTAEFQPLFQRSLIFSFGARIVSSTTFWLFPWQQDSGAGAVQSTPGALFPPMSGRVRSLRVLHSTPVASADNITYELFIGASATALSATLNTGSAGPASDLVNIVNVSAVDDLFLRATGATASRTIRPAVYVIFEF